MVVKYAAMLYLDRCGAARHLLTAELKPEREEAGQGLKDVVGATLHS